ncbi:MAG: GerW family sporulation protein [Clostridia bacterium]|jgi:uncharacterized spore protein YtfJ|nr:GerW family sporulation protein [Clostridia bacterium]MCI1959463.1 GerW family sporulation protein [Clostridia bacterium]MCI2000955.1 GerW family sporulation protein [Clostridia bacterium]MCI2015739.1 GerW family sporulation protein [Clostridia bacterium]
MGENINSSIDALCAKLGEFVSSKTVVGEAVHVGDITLIPLIEATFGMGAGGNEKSGKNGQAGGMGAKIAPSAVIAIVEGHVQLINIKNQDALNKIIDLAPSIVSKFKFDSVFNKKAEEAKKSQSEEASEK